MLLSDSNSSSSALPNYTVINNLKKSLDQLLSKKSSICKELSKQVIIPFFMILRIFLKMIRDLIAYLGRIMGTTKKWDKSKINPFLREFKKKNI